ncbi:protein GAMETE EXPRESSED 2 [Sesamum alatum]|uniref:Protein GAMETE EXPRESSED 2 n=1 Tax=Sesamum alatum TaxID=300844 RepID=A0AAE1Y9M0_9LAMI|nr:protein GAMETE EXPRESSED 2 [Sesamum alatum]
MASQELLLFTLLTFFTFSLKPQPARSDNVAMPAFAFSWPNDKDTFMAGDTAIINVRVLGNYESGKYEFPFKPNITVNDKMGNSSFVTGVTLHVDGGTESWSISFVPIMVGLFNVLITDQHFHVLDSSLHFLVNPGRMYSPAGILLWVDGLDEFIAGKEAEVLILPKDAFGNNVSSASEGPIPYNFTLFASTLNGFPANILNITQKGWNQQGYLSIGFVAATAGTLLLHVQVDNQTLDDPPLPFKVNPGKLDVHSCKAQWNVENKYFQLFSMMEGFIHQHDQYGNLVSGLYAFDIEVIEKGTNLSMPVADLLFKDIGPGVQSFSFSLHEPGNFMLMISDKEKNTLISNMPYDFTVYIGYCDGENSIVNGSGLNNTVAGDIATFSVFLKDAYLYPSPVDLENLQVQIVGESDSKIIPASIRIREAVNGSFPSGRLDFGLLDPVQIASAPVFAGNRNHKSSDFDVIYKPEKSGTYEIRVFCGNIPLNGGHPFKKEVSPGAVNVSLSGVVKFAQKVPRLIKNEIVVQLVDSYYNPVLLQQSKLKLEIASLNKSASLTWMFSDDNDGTYSGSYLAKDVGTYEICASYNEERFLPCPFGVNVYNSEYFPKAYNDTVSVWEDESIPFNVLENDCFAGGNASILEYSKPGHGSLLQHGNVFRYTPYKGFYGNDSFLYTIADINENHASGSVDLLILCRPPQFVSLPSNLQATEDVVSPTFGGFSGFEIVYSDLAENISVTLSSLSGTVLLSPTQMQFWQPRRSELYVHKEAGTAGELTLVGSLDAINFALQSIQYFGNENFYGGDTIRVSTINRNGRNDIDVPIYVQPINDPPVINIPSFVILDGMNDGVLIFGEQRDNFDFIGDPDLLNFPGTRSSFLIMFSIEVSAGLLSTSLPAVLVGSTELKLKTSYQWQPLQTFVTISKHFLVKAKGIRFRGTIDDCNTIMEHLSYHEGEHGAVLTVTANDLGNHGCYPNCAEMMSMCLFAESTVNLIRHRPISSLAAHTLGSAIVIESIAVFSLSLLLLFFICKCAAVLVHEKKRQKAQDIQLSERKGSSKQNLAGDSSRNEKLLTGYCPLPFVFEGQHSYSQRSVHVSGTEEADESMKHSPQSPSNQHEDILHSDAAPSVSLEG